MDTKQIGDLLENRTRGVFNNLGMKLSITKEKKDGQIDLQGFNYKTGKEVYVECKSRSTEKVDNAVIAVFVNKLIKRKALKNNQLCRDCEAYVVTDSYFTKEAVKDAQFYNIGLVDQRKLSQLEALANLDSRLGFVKQISKISNYIKEYGVGNLLGYLVRRKIFK